MSDTLIECIRNYFLHCEYEKHLSAKTLKAYQIDLRQFSDFIEQQETNALISGIGRDILREYLRTLSERGKPKTTKRKLATLKAFFNYLEFEDIITVNPFRKIKFKINEGKQLPRTIAFSKITTLFQYIYTAKKIILKKQPHLYRTAVRDIAMIELLFATGARVAELCNLKMENIDLVKGSIKIVGKGNRERIIPVCDRNVLSAVQEYYELFSAEIMICGFFFINRLKTRLSEQSVRFMIKRHSRAAKVNARITPHMFRHSVATLLLERGVDIRYIQALLGHSSIVTTQIYVQVNDEAQRKILIDRHPRGEIMG